MTPREEKDDGDEAVAPPVGGTGEQAAFVEANLRRNYLAHFTDGMLSFTGFRLISTPTFTPAYLFVLTGSATMVGLGSSLLQAGAMLSPVLVAAALDHRARILPVAAWIGWFMRAMILALALAGWFLSGTAAILASFAALFFLGLGMGGQRVAFQLLLSKVIPVARRGRLQGWRNFFGGIIAAGMSWAAGTWLLGSEPTRSGYAAIFFLTFALSGLGLMAISFLMREPVRPARSRGALSKRVAAVSSHFTDREFRRFLAAQACCTMARAVSPFYILHAGHVIGLDGAAVGALALAFTASDTLFNLIWGRIGDARGYRLIFLLTLLLWIAATVLLLFARSEALVYLAFAGLGGAFSGFLMSQQTMVLEFGSHDDLAMRLGLTNTIDGVTSAIGPAIGGILAVHYGYQPLFIASGGLLCVALILLLGVRDPRHPFPQGAS